MPTPRSIDHIVIAVPDLDETVRCFEALGFSLTARAHHPWGTDNRLVQLSDQTFLELLEVARPELIPEADFSHTPARFSFGAHNRDYLARFGAGISMLALTGRDTKADAAEFASHGMGAYAPFSFGRKARQPDGSEREVAFELAFAHPTQLPELVFFTCHNKFPENFWKSAFQQHRNGVSRLKGIILTSDEPNLLTPFLSHLSGGKSEDGDRWALGRHWLDLIAPAQLVDRFPDCGSNPSAGSRFTALSFAVQNLDQFRDQITRAVPDLICFSDINRVNICLPATGDVILEFCGGT